MAIKEEKQFRFTWKMGLVVFSILIVIVFLAFFFGIVKKTCTDEECFSDALKKCGMARYLKLQNYNYYRYTIEGTRGDECLINVELVKMALGSPQDKIDLFEGKGMTCRVPKKELSLMQSSKIEGMLKYCSGPLKEAMYQLIIEKLYTLIVSNMGQIIGEIEEVMVGGLEGSVVSEA